MSFEIPQDKTESQAASAPTLTPLDEILAMIRRDIVSDPQQYLDDTAVPHGGE